MISIRDYINESKNKDEFYNVHTTSDKYYKAIRNKNDGWYMVTLDDILKHGWWKPENKITPEQQKELYNLRYASEIQKLDRKNPITGKPTGITIDTGCWNGIKFNVNMRYNGEDTSESLAACIDYILDKFDNIIPGTRKKDYKGILKDVRKELLDMYNNLPEPLSKADREKLHNMLTQDPLTILSK